MKAPIQKAGAERLISQIKQATPNTVFGGSIGSVGGSDPSSPEVSPTARDYPESADDDGSRKVMVEVTTTARGESQKFQVSIDVPGPGTPVVVGPFILTPEASR